jgi:hypothetical protein
MTATIVPSSWLDPSTKVPAAWIRDAKSLENERGNALYFVSVKQYTREVHAHNDCANLGFYPLGAELRLVGEGRDFRIVIPVGRKPHVLARHLSRIAPVFFFDLVREVLNGDYLDADGE